jgi:hypothetical protein
VSTAFCIVHLGRTTLHVDARAWPVVATAEGGEGRTKWTLTVRRHRDGRALVAGTRAEGQPVRAQHAGVLVAARDPIGPAVARVAEALGCPDVGRAVVAQLGAPAAVAS